MRCDRVVSNYMSSLKKLPAIADGPSRGVPQAIADGYPTTHEIRNVSIRQVHRNLRKDTPESVRLGIIENCIFKGSTKKRQLRDIHTLLQSARLLTMLLEHRRVPIITEDNSFGYSGPHIVTYNIKSAQADDSEDDLFSINSTVQTSNTESIALLEDDYGLYAHDKARLII